MKMPLDLKGASLLQIMSTESLIHNTGDTVLAFASTELARTHLKSGFSESNLNAKPFAIEIAFTTENVDEVYNTAIKAGATAEAPQPGGNPRVRRWLMYVIWTASSLKFAHR
jgi:hypothetical protein